MKKLSQFKLKFLMIRGWWILCEYKLPLQSWSWTDLLLSTI